MEFVEARVAHQVAPPTIAKPPMRAVDVQTQRRRSGRTRTGMGLGRAPMTRVPTPIPTAVATIVTIHDATGSTYSFVRAVSFRTGSFRIENWSISARNRNPNRIHHRFSELGPTVPPRHHPPKRTPKASARHLDVHRGRWPGRRRPTWIAVPRRSHRTSGTGTHRAA